MVSSARGGRSWNVASSYHCLIGSIGTLRIWPRSYVASVLNRKWGGLGSGSAPHPTPHGEAAMAGGCFW